MADDRCVFHYDYPLPHKRLGGGCQFSDETEVFPCDDAFYCRFHLPLNDKLGIPTVKAGWQDPLSDGALTFRAAIKHQLAHARERGTGLNLSGVVFPNTVDFRGTAIPRSQWYGTWFHEPAVFANAKFEGAADFQNAVFQSFADFEDAKFQAYANFQDAKFQAYAVFRDTEFRGYAGFGHAEFRHGADFSFLDRTATPERQAMAAADPDRGAFHRLQFRGALLGGQADFSNRRFKQATDFSGCRFGQAPKFHNATLYQDTDWQGAEFKERKGGEAERAYRTLRLAMETNRDRPQEAVFFALEQQAMRSLRPWWHANRLLSYAYQVTSGYGRSAVLPLLWLVGSLMAFFLIYWTLDGWQSGRDEALTTFTAQQAVKPFAVWGRVATDLSPLFLYDSASGAMIPLGFKLLATLQSVLNLSFVALFILALRWLFKRG